MKYFYTIYYIGCKIRIQSILRTYTLIRYIGITFICIQLNAYTCYIAIFLGTYYMYKRIILDIKIHFHYLTNGVGNNNSSNSTPNDGLRMYKSIPTYFFRSLLI